MLFSVKKRLWEYVIAETAHDKCFGHSGGVLHGTWVSLIAVYSGD